MAVEKQMKIKCRDCGAETQFTKWESINGELNPGARDRLLDGSIFEVTCSGCGKELLVKYDMLYHDIEHKVMIQYASDGNIENAINAYRESISQIGLPNGMAPLMGKYHIRMVKDQNDLREKAVIFHAGLDDRVIEIIKVFYRYKVEQEMPDAEIDKMYFCVAEDHSYVLQFVGKKHMAVQIPRDMYQQVKARYEAAIAAAKDQDFVIDEEWALSIIRQVVEG